MIVVKLRDAIEAYRRRTFQKLTYEGLSSRCGVSVSVLKKIATVWKYRPSLDTIEKICRALEVTPGDLLELMDDPPTSTKTKSRTMKKKRPRRRD